MRNAVLIGMLCGHLNYPIQRSDKLQENAPILRSSLHVQWVAEKLSAYIQKIIQFLFKLKTSRESLVVQFLQLRVERGREQQSGKSWEKISPKENHFPKLNEDKDLE